MVKILGKDCAPCGIRALVAGLVKNETLSSDWDCDGRPWLMLP
jgi:hypothetical protein